ETLFAELLLAALALTVLARGRSRVLALAGVLMAASACVRSAGIAAAAVWACYVAISNRRQWRALVAAGAGFVAPLVVYVGGVAASGHGVGVTTSDGWFLYARVAPVANCRGAAVPRATRPLCQPAPARAAS